MLGDGSLLVAGISGACDDLVLKTVGSDRSVAESRIEGAELGGDCAARVVDVTATDAGNDVLVELRDETRGGLESDVLTPTSLVRVDDAGRPVEDFGENGLIPDIGGSVATLPDGGVVASAGTLYTPDGIPVETDSGTAPQAQPDFIPGAERVASTPAEQILRAGEARDAAGAMVVARYDRELELDPGFGRAGVATIGGLGEPAQLLATDDGGALGLTYSGALARLDPSGSLDRSYGRRGIASTFDLTLAGTINRMAERGGEITLLRIGQDGPDLLRLDRGGEMDRAFDPRLARPGSVEVTDLGGDLVLDAEGNAIVLTDVQDDAAPGRIAPEIHAFDPAGEPAPALPGGEEKIVLD